MGRKSRPHEIIILEPDRGSGVGLFLLGAALGAGVALLLAPASGEETRRRLARQARELRDSAEEAIDDLKDRFDAFTSTAEEDDEEEAGDEEELAEEDEDAAPEPETLSDARAELERRLEAARARRRFRGVEEEEPVA